MMNLELSQKHSPDFNLKKFNNYDNTVKYADKKVFSEFNIHHNYKKDNQRDHKTLKNLDSPDTHFNLASSAFGPGKKTHLFATTQKRSRSNLNADIDNSDMSVPTTTSTNMKIKQSKAQMYKQNSIYDSNLSNLLTENRKIIARKNYELDSRAYGLKDFGIQPQMNNKLTIKRNID
jgi:hypothetical protein